MPWTPKRPRDREKPPFPQLPQSPHRYLVLNFSQRLDHCGPTGISTSRQGEDKDQQLKFLGMKPSSLVRGRVERESSRPSYAAGCLLPSQAESVVLSQQNVRERGISTQICVKRFPHFSKQLPESKTLPVGNTSGPFCLCPCSFAVLHGHQRGERESFQNHPKTESQGESQLAREKRRQEKLPRPCCTHCAASAARRPCSGRAAGLPGEGTAVVPAGSPVCLGWGCAVLCQRWEKAGSRPGSSTRAPRGTAALGACAGHSGSAPFPVSLGDSGCTPLNGEQTSALPPALPCSHRSARRPGSGHPLGCAKGFP